jgi:hypothetical protein
LADDSILGVLGECPGPVIGEESESDQHADLGNGLKHVGDDGKELCEVADGTEASTEEAAEAGGGRPLPFLGSNVLGVLGVSPGPVIVGKSDEHAESSDGLEHADDDGKELCDLAGENILGVLGENPGPQTNDDGADGATSAAGLGPAGGDCPRHDLRDLVAAALVHLCTSENEHHLMLDKNRIVEVASEIVATVVQELYTAELETMKEEAATKPRRRRRPG